MDREGCRLRPGTILPDGPGESGYVGSVDLRGDVRHVSTSGTGSAWRDVSDSVQRGPAHRLASPGGWVESEIPPAQFINGPVPRLNERVLDSADEVVHGVDISSDLKEVLE